MARRCGVRMFLRSMPNTLRSPLRMAPGQQVVGRHVQGLGELACVASLRVLPFADDAVEGRQRKTRRTGELAQGPLPAGPKPVHPFPEFGTEHGPVVPQTGTVVNSVPKSGTQRGATLVVMPTPRVHDDYARTLGGYLERLKSEQGMTTDQITKESGLGRTTLWRFTSPKDTAVPTLASAEDLQSYLSRKLPGVSVPPPTIPTRTEEHYEWARVGEWLMEHDPAEFMRLLQRVQQIKAGKEAALALGTKDDDGREDV